MSVNVLFSGVTRFRQLSVDVLSLWDIIVLSSVVYIDLFSLFMFLSLFDFYFKWRRDAVLSGSELVS
jgi:hypothetical protein